MCLTGASETSIRKRHEETHFFYREATLFLPVGISDLTLLSDRFSSQSLKDLVYNERTASIRVSNKRSRLIDRRKPFSI